MSRSPEGPMTPYLIGAGIGALNVCAFLSAKRGLGVSSAFENFAAQAERKLAPDVTHVNAYLKECEIAPKTDWQSLLILGIPLGSFLAARAFGKKETPESSPVSQVSSVWSDNFGSSRPKRYLGAFLGGAVMMMGARFAKGCTSGHGITGTSQLAVSSLIFTSLMFATAAVASRVIYKKDNS